MSFSLDAPVYAAGAEEATVGFDVAPVPETQQMTVSLGTHAFSKQLGAARRTALSEPEVIARMLSDWMYVDG